MEPEAVLVFQCGIVRKRGQDHWGSTGPASDHFRRQPDTLLFIAFGFFPHKFPEPANILGQLPEYQEAAVAAEIVVVLGLGRNRETLVYVGVAKQELTRIDDIIHVATDARAFYHRLGDTVTEAEVFLAPG